MNPRYLTTEPPLDPPEEIDYNAIRSKRDSKQEMDLDITNTCYKRPSTLINNPRMTNNAASYSEGVI